MVGDGENPLEVARELGVEGKVLVAAFRKAKAAAGSADLFAEREM